MISYENDIKHQNNSKLPYMAHFEVQKFSTRLVPFHTHLRKKSFPVNLKLLSLSFWNEIFFEISGKNA